MWAHCTHLALVIWLYITKVGNSINSTLTPTKKKLITFHKLQHSPITITLRLQCRRAYSAHHMKKVFCSTITHWCTPNFTIIAWFRMPNTESETDKCKIQIYECNSHPIYEATQLKLSFLKDEFEFISSNNSGQSKLHTTISIIHWALDSRISLWRFLWLRFNHFEIKSSISSVPILLIPFSFEKCQTLSMMMTMTYYFSTKNVDERILSKSFI